jgi:hypothetical protein
MGKRSKGGGVFTGQTRAPFFRLVDGNNRSVVLVTVGQSLAPCLIDDNGGSVVLLTVGRSHIPLVCLVALLRNVELQTNLHGTERVFLKLTAFERVWYLRYSCTA